MNLMPNIGAFLFLKPPRLRLKFSLATAQCAGSRRPSAYPELLGCRAIFHWIYMLSRGDQALVSTLVDLMLLLMNESGDVLDTENPFMTIPSQNFSAQPELNGAAFLFFASRAMVWVPLQTNRRF